MSELSGSDALDSVRIRFQVLKQARPGDIVVLDAAGRWILQPSSSWAVGNWKSAMRKIWALFSPSPIESQRQAFLKSAKESVKVLIHHCRLMMKTELFNRATDETGVISIKVTQKLNATDLSDLEMLLQNLQAFCSDLHDGIHGLNNVLQHQPYADDLTFCAETRVSLADPVRDFLEQTYRRLGAFGPKLLPFFNRPPPPSAPEQTGNANPHINASIAPHSNHWMNATPGFVALPHAQTQLARPPNQGTATAASGLAGIQCDEAGMAISASGAAAAVASASGSGSGAGSGAANGGVTASGVPPGTLPRPLSITNLAYSNNQSSTPTPTAAANSKLKK
jgi:hypothetical protein